MGENNYSRMNFILIFLFSGFLGWAIKTVLDSLIFFEKSFLDVFIFDLSNSEFLIRIIVSVCFSITGVLFYKNYLMRKDAQEKLKKAKEKLEKLNKNLNTKVDEKTQDVEKLLRDKTKLIIGLSHDLRTPLTPCMGILPIILKKEKDPEIKKYFEVISQNIHYMRDLVSKTIDIARYDQDLITFDIKKTNLYEEINKVIENNNQYLQKNEIYVDNLVEEDTFIYVDDLRFREVINNLIENAVKFKINGKDGVVIIKSKEDGENITLSVADKGIGLKKEEIDNIFDELYKSDESRHDLKSNGLGLSICKRIIEKHGGKIWAESDGINKGLRFIFTIPKR